MHELRGLFSALKHKGFMSVSMPAFPAASLGMLVPQHRAAIRSSARPATAADIVMMDFSQIKHSSSALFQIAR